MKDVVKRGWNWGYLFSEKVLPDGERCTIVSERLFYCSKWKVETVISGFTGGHDYENATRMAIGEAFSDFFRCAHEEGVGVNATRDGVYFEVWLIYAPVDSGLVQSFASALAAINRVRVVMNPAKGTK